MSQDLKKAQSKSKDVLDLIAKQTLSESERKQVTEESVQFWKDHVNEGFLQYRKSVSTDYTAVEWEDEGAVFRDINGKEFLDML
ncbi:MAG TPA: putrescine aminotransferase, partial [Candidatus Obscuribacterales bacterium]|nr:putrescine aminotransferase [Candidatus Obscuribacterales bacterium]